VYKISIGKPEEKRSLRRLRRAWEDNIKIDIKETEWSMWTGLIWLWIGIVGGIL
jgi:hypothetical protein